MKLSIIIPVYNEEQTVKELLKRVLNCKLPPGLKKEVIVIDDGSTDGTGRILKNIKNKEIVFIKHQINLGKGAAIRNGFKSSSGDLLIIQDADLEYNPNDIRKLLKPILSGKTKVVYGTRLKNYRLNLWGKNKTILPLHLIANRLLTFLTNQLYLSQLTDMETCYKLFTKEVKESLSLNSERFNIEPELTAKILKQRYKIYEVPITVKPRTFQEGKKINWIDGLGAVWTLLKYRFIN